MKGVGRRNLATLYVLWLYTRDYNSRARYHSAIENIPIEKFESLFTPLIQSLFLPYLVIFLHVSRQTQLSRARDKQDDALQRRLLNSEVFQQLLNEAYNKTKRLIKVPWLQIDTSKSSISESVEVIMKKSKTILEKNNR